MRGMKLYRALVVANAVFGALLASAGSVTAMFTNLGGARVAAVVLGVVGVTQLVISAVLHSVSGPPTLTASQN